MSDAQPARSPSPLSFERAEYDSATALSCGFCKRPLEGLYWQVARRSACAACRARVQHQLEQRNSRAHFWSALGYGAAAAVAGSVGWMLITKLTGYELGLVAIGIGYLVGKAVRRGAGGFGGTRYQIMAMFLTYSAIALASLPSIAAYASQASQSPATLVWPTIVALAYASPFLAGKENIMGLVIMAIGLYEAWKFTRGADVSVLGPFEVAPTLPLVSSMPGADATE